MLEAVPLLVTTGILISIFTMAYARLQLAEVRKNWQQRRCDPFVISMAHLVPDDPTIDPSEFAMENFKFCLNTIIDGVVGFTMKPVLGLFQEQTKMTRPLQDVLNNLRGAAMSLIGPMTEIFDVFFQKFKIVGQQMARIFFKLLSAFDRVFGILIATVFAGFSLIKGVQNFIGFVIQVCIIILVILSILVIWLWFVMWPLIPVILLAIGFISTTVYAANVSGLSGSFCVAPGTRVHIKGKGWVAVEKVKAGDVLEEGGIVEGTLKMTGQSADLVSLYGVTMSKTHLVSYGKAWIPAEHHPDVANATSSPSVLYCLNTSTRSWTVYGTKGPFVLRDWEELPEGYDTQWEDLIRGFLKGDPSSCPGRPLFGPGTQVWSRTRGEVYLRNIELGEEIDRGDGVYVKVLGIIYDISEKVPKEGPNNAVWRWQPETMMWGHAPQTRSLPFNTGWNLIVEGGVFMTTQGILARDFTEIGATEIYKTYDFTEQILNGHHRLPFTGHLATTSSPVSY